MTRNVLVLLALTAGCKSKPKSEPAPVAGSASAVAVQAVDAAANTVKLPAGAPTFGCIGWNPTTKSVACITGEDAAGEPPSYQLEYVNGGEPATPLTDVAAANAMLAKLGMVAFPSPAKHITTPYDTDLGEGATLVWSQKVTDEGGENQAARSLYEAAVTCANKQTVEIYKEEQEGLGLEFYLWSVPGHAVIELASHIGREGESRSMRKVGLLELATCKYIDS